jgi:hypothetical protein
MYPRISMLVQKDYFRFIKVNLNKICQFWPDDAKCGLKDCQLKECNQDDLPNNFKSYFQENPESVTDEECEQGNPLGHLNTTLTDDNLKVFEEWTKFDDAQDNFCELEDELTTSTEYRDLLTNPERYTGYKAPHSHKIWNSIYRENCFADENPKQSTYGPNIGEKDTCLEKRVFYRLVSGLHTSINIQLCAKYLHKGVLNQPDVWGPNPSEFQRRFDPQTTNGQGPQWLKNLYFLYLVELRAISKAQPYLQAESFYAGRSSQEDVETKQAVLDILNHTKSFKNYFDESILFRGDPAQAQYLKEQFKLKFRNITKIMDCVGCDKCRLWGKVQTMGLGTALKILFSGKPLGLESTVDANEKKTFQLSRSEIVALFNGFAKLSFSIAEIENFRELLSLKEPKVHENISLKGSGNIPIAKTEF